MQELSRQVSTTEGREFAQRMGMGFIGESQLLMLMPRLLFFEAWNP